MSAGRTMAHELAIYFWNEFLYIVVFITRQQSRTLPLAIQSR